MPLEIICGDIYKMNVDVIVNAASTSNNMGGAISRALFQGIGEPSLQEEYDRNRKCNIGEAVITKGFNLRAKYVIHTVCPVWLEGKSEEDNILSNCYTNSLKVAIEHKCTSIAFPLLGVGSNGLIIDKAFNVAIQSIRTFLNKNEINVWLIKENSKPFFQYTKHKHYDYITLFLLGTLANYFIHNIYNIPKDKFNSILSQKEDSFSKKLLKLIDSKGIKDPDAYKKSNISRKLFSKIQSDEYYKPRKRTVLGFAIGLELNLEETSDLLARAGYTLSNSISEDLIVKYFIKKKLYNIDYINDYLLSINAHSLGGNYS